MRITYNRVQRFVTTGVRVYPNQWRDGVIIKRLDALELQQTLDLFVAEARKVVNGLMERGELDMKTIASVISGRQRRSSVENVSESRLLMEYFSERAEVRKYGRSADSQERYNRFLRWFESWGVMVTFEDVTELNVLKMDEALGRRGMKP